MSNLFDLSNEIAVVIGATGVLGGALFQEIRGRKGACGAVQAAAVQGAVEQAGWGVHGWEGED